MKKITLILMLICCFILSSCRNDDSSEELDPHSNFQAIEYNNMIMNEVMPKVEKALVEDDIEIIKSMFSPYVLETQPSLENELKELVLAFEGEIVSFDEEWPINGAGSKRNGIYVFRETRFGYRRVETSTGKVYRIKVYYTIVNDENPDEVGLTKIFLYDISEQNIPIARAGDFPLPQRPLL